MYRFPCNFIEFEQIPYVNLSESGKSVKCTEMENGTFENYSEIRQHSSEYKNNTSFKWQCFRFSQNGVELENDLCQSDIC